MVSSNLLWVLGASICAQLAAADEALYPRNGSDVSPLRVEGGKGDGGSGKGGGDDKNCYPSTVTLWRTTSVCKQGCCDSYC